VYSHKDFVIALMVEEGMLTPEAAERATRHAAEHKVSVPESVVTLGAATVRQVAIARAAISECPYVELDHYDIDLKNAALLPKSAAERQLAFPALQPRPRHHRRNGRPHGPPRGRPHPRPPQGRDRARSSASPSPSAPSSIAPIP
jgi:hypothetical protein